MTTFMTVLLGLTLMATLGVMFAGMLGLARSETAGGVRSNRLMRWRVVLQGVTVVLFLILIAISRG